MAKGDRQWHVPANTWHSGPPGGLSTNLNVGVDIAATLISTDSAANLDVPDSADEYVVERVIGQWMLHGDQASPAPYFVHNRIYPTVSDATTIILRDLTSPDDAESDFLYHSVHPWSSTYDGDIWGNWQQGQQPSPPALPGFMGRHGHVDVRVNRRIRQGFSLIWHTQLKGGVDPVNDEFILYLWLRMLLREA